MLFRRPTTTVVKQISDSPCNQIVNCLLSDHCSHHHHKHHHHHLWQFQNIVPSQRVQDKEDVFNLIGWKYNLKILSTAKFDLDCQKWSLQNGRFGEKLIFCAAGIVWNFRWLLVCIFAMLQLAGYNHRPHDYVQLTFLKKVGYKCSAKQVRLNFARFELTRMAGTSNERQMFTIFKEVKYFQNRTYVRMTNILRWDLCSLTLIVCTAT